jgi:hypothetical protein
LVNNCFEQAFVGKSKNAVILGIDFWKEFTREWDEGALANINKER